MRMVIGGGFRFEAIFVKQATVTIGDGSAIGVERKPVFIERHLVVIIQGFYHANTVVAVVIDIAKHADTFVVEFEGGAINHLMRHALCHFAESEATIFTQDSLFADFGPDVFFPFFVTL